MLLRSAAPCINFKHHPRCGNEVGSRVLKTPPATQDIINMGRDLLLM